MRTRSALDHLFVPPEEMRVFMGHFLSLVKQRADEIFKNRGSLDGPTWTIGYKLNWNYSSL